MLPLYLSGGEMLIKILSMVFDSARGGFNDDELRDFIKDKEIVCTPGFKRVLQS